MGISESRQEVDAAFRAKLKELNPEANVYDTVELQFSPLEETYLSEHPGDGLFAIIQYQQERHLYIQFLWGLEKQILPFIQLVLRQQMILKTLVLRNGNGCFKGAMCSAAETIVYPLCY